MQSRFDIFATSHNHKGSTGGPTKAQWRERTVNDIQTKISKPNEKTISFWNRKIDRTLWRANWTVWRLDTGAKAIRKDAVRWWKQRYNLGGDIARKAKKYQIGALKENTRAKEMYGERISFRSDPRNETTPHLSVILCPLTKRGNLSAERRDRRQKKCRRTQEKFLEAIRKGCLVTKYVWSRKAQFNDLDQEAFTKRWYASIKEHEDKLSWPWRLRRDVKFSLKTKKKNNWT